MPQNVSQIQPELYADSCDNYSFTQSMTAPHELAQIQNGTVPLNLESERSGKHKKYIHPHVIIPCSDMEWAFQQRIPVLKLWGDAWRSDPYGSRWVRLETTLGKENFRKAKKDLIEAGLFLFECRIESFGAEQKYCWWVRNLHGCRTDYWKNAQKNSDLNNIPSEFHTEKQSENDLESNLNNILPEFHTEKANPESDGNLGANTINSDFPSQNDSNKIESLDARFKVNSQQSPANKVDIYIDKSSNLDNLPSTNGDAIKVKNQNPGVGVPSTGGGADCTGGGNESTILGTTGTNQLGVNALMHSVSRVLKNVSETAYKHFSNSLNIQAREGFINFCIEKILSLKKANFEVRTWDAWIARHYEQYMNEWKVLSSTRVETPKQTSLDEFNSWRAELLEKEKRAKEERKRRREQLEPA
ncbi:hypothetical protein CAL7716_056760 [Calothrix sp. PCC 7716]|nr:hypothetical protein CAL7716_056760 [Calothrix sp. PCC 7716]